MSRLRKSFCVVAWTGGCHSRFDTIESTQFRGILAFLSDNLVQGTVVSKVSKMTYASCAFRRRDEVRQSPLLCVTCIGKTSTCLRQDWSGVPEKAHMISNVTGTLGR
jgi:hypothetical protein